MGKFRAPDVREVAVIKAWNAGTLTLESLAEPGAERQQFGGVFSVSAHKEVLEILEAPQGSWRRSCSVWLSVNLSKTIIQFNHGAVGASVGALSK